MDGNHTDIVPCGKCPKCKRKRQSEWVFRLSQEQKVSKSAAFITLTYDDENLPKSFNGHATLQPDHLTNFWKRLRKINNSSKPIRYYAVGEYGTKFQRPHYHAIVFNINHTILQHNDKLQNIWSHGSIDIAKSEGASQRYTLGYIMDTKWNPTQDDDDRYPQFSRKSQKLGINFLTPDTINYYNQRELPAIILPGGNFMHMPRYYKEKIFKKETLRKITKEYIKHNELTDQEFQKVDFGYELQIIKNETRKHEKQLKLKEKHTF
jgi:hypothetical protein